ncbi:GAF domain protein [Gregarina niphandrodes]|uniref:GAF domain protein n=1 Tax=Gregarina niphandrodes TaxID=110365 RepID=A0A023B9M9_GRENI|nr:GAF domain protein [Gregarina niphandrodes]EZG72964.1 GAF domain protein [Gregarina niphandrodes]|eukprot:XP_011129723.1 GAF domain protein [Gregarina niphandrodes]
MTYTYDSTGEFAHDTQFVRGTAQPYAEHGGGKGAANRYEAANGYDGNVYDADQTRFEYNASPAEVYADLLNKVKALTGTETSWISATANVSSLLWYLFSTLDKRVNWCGFYFYDSVSDELQLGPFQGRVACQSIKLGKGVCGVAGDLRTTQLVPDVREFPGHIACDGETRSEIVVPVVSEDGLLRAVLDIDSTELNAFDTHDQFYLEQLSHLLSKGCRWP